MNVRTIVLTGPESSGKTTLARELAGHFGVPWVPEFARTYLDENGSAYTEADLLAIAKGQVALEVKMRGDTDNLLFLDTSLEVIKIWSEVKFGRCHPWILKTLNARKHDFYLLCEPDIVWKFDPLRENPADRDALFTVYFEQLTELSVNFATLNGLGTRRIQNAIKQILTITNTNEPPHHP